MKKRELKLEINQKLIRSNDEHKLPSGGVVLMTPCIDEDYWTLRVKLTKTQAIVGFPKFYTIGVGFAKETDWNTNLPYSCGTEELFNHIKDNKRYKSISDEDCKKAISMIQAAVEVLGVKYFYGEENPDKETFARAMKRVANIAKGRK